MRGREAGKREGEEKAQSLKESSLSHDDTSITEIRARLRVNSRWPSWPGALLTVDVSGFLVLGATREVHTHLSPLHDDEVTCGKNPYLNFSLSLAKRRLLRRTKRLFPCAALAGLADRRKHLYLSSSPSAWALCERAHTPASRERDEKGSSFEK